MKSLVNVISYFILFEVCEVSLASMPPSLLWLRCGGWAWHWRRLPNGLSKKAMRCPRLMEVAPSILSRWKKTISIIFIILYTGVFLVLVLFVRLMVIRFNIDYIYIYDSYSIPVWCHCFFLTALFCSQKIYRRTASCQAKGPLPLEMRLTTGVALPETAGVVTFWWFRELAEDVLLVSAVSTLMITT